MCRVTLYLVAWIMIEETDSRAEDEVVSQMTRGGERALQSKADLPLILKLIHLHKAKAGNQLLFISTVKSA